MAAAVVSLRRRPLVGRRRQDAAGRLRQRRRTAGPVAAGGAVPVPRWVLEGGAGGSYWWEPLGWDASGGMCNTSDKRRGPASEGQLCQERDPAFRSSGRVAGRSPAAPLFTREGKSAAVGAGRRAALRVPRPDVAGVAGSARAFQL